MITMGLSKDVFENDDDAINEAELADIIERIYSVKMVRQRKFAQFDYIACKGNHISAFVEMRCLNAQYDAHKTVMISASKLLAAKTMIDISGIKHFFVVRWIDGVVGLSVINRFLMNGVELVRSPITDKRRNAPDDLEPVAYIPIEAFKVIVEKQ
jgi:hypothetical protein